MGRGAGQSHFWKPVSLNKLISGNQCFFNKWKPRAEGRPSLRLRLWVFLGRGSLRIHAWLSCGVGHWPLASAATSCLSLRPQAPLPPGGPGAVSDPSAPTPRGCVSLSSSSAPCVEWLAGVKARPGGALGHGRTDPWLPSSLHRGRAPATCPTWSFCRQSPGQVCSRHSETLSSAQMAQISGTGSQQGTSCVLFPPQVGESLQPAPPPPPPYYRARGAAPAAARSWRLGGGGSSLRPAAVNPRS